MRGSSPRAQSRADEVRQRRQQRSQQNASRVPKRATYSAIMPVVVTRGGAGMPVVRRAISRPRRKMIIPLGSPGAEMHMPAIPSIRPGWRLVSGFIVLITSGIIYALLNMSFFQISNPQIEGNQRVTAADIEAVLSVQGMPIVQFDPQAARLALANSFHELKDIHVQLSIPARLKIHVSERQPLIEWQHGDQPRWIDAEGVLFSPRGDGGSLLVVQSNTTPPLQKAVAAPVEEERADLLKKEEAVQGPVYEKLDRDLLDAILKMSSIMPQGTVLVYSGEQGLGWLAPEGWQVYVGAWLDNLDTKLKVYSALVDYLNRQGIRPMLISIAQPNAPFYRMEQ
ncbi:MAG: FtsQ-type POTRA domain-containing protein [Anaerolineae bacterium]|nr:FtsQ-type POTRA domain-containing protein [Anaerolineae bacterium]